MKGFPPLRSCIPATCLLSSLCPCAALLYCISAGPHRQGHRYLAAYRRLRHAWWVCVSTVLCRQTLAFHRVHKAARFARRSSNSGGGSSSSHTLHFCRNARGSGTVWRTAALATILTQHSARYPGLVHIDDVPHPRSSPALPQPCAPPPGFEHCIANMVRTVWLTLDGRLFDRLAGLLFDRGSGHTHAVLAVVVPYHTQTCSSRSSAGACCACTNTTLEHETPDVLLWAPLSNAAVPVRYGLVRRRPHHSQAVHLVSTPNPSSSKPAKVLSLPRLYRLGMQRPLSVRVVCAFKKANL